MRHVLISTFFDHEINCYELTLPFMPLVLSLKISDTAASENHSTSSCLYIKENTLLIIIKLLMWASFFSLKITWREEDAY